MAYVIKTKTASGRSAWIKRQAGQYRIRPREQAAFFSREGEAQEVIRELPNYLGGKAQFSVEAADFRTLSPCAD